MIRTAYVFFFVLAGTSALTVSACSGGQIAVGSSTQTLKKQKNGAPTGNGTACGWDLPVSSEPGAAGGSSTPGGTSKVGDNFKAPDGCNDCTCTDQGIACTEIACGGGGACTEEAKQCPDGSFVVRVGPSCEFQACPGVGCTEEVKQCPDGTSVGRTGPTCEFAPCPTVVACDTLAKVCPDGTAVGRVAPSCEFAPCPQACDLDVPNTCPPGTTCKVPSGLPTRNGTCK